MTSQTWQDVRDSMGQVTFTLGPYFADQLLSKPRHLLFSLSRYKFASRLLPLGAPVKVLELGCAEGIGTLLLAENGHEIMAIDFDENAIKYAQQSIHNDRITFLADDFIGKEYGKFNAIVSLDVIEHVAPDQEQRFLDTVVANLAPDGFCVIGTPNETASPYASKQSQIGHVNLYTAERMAQSLRRYFHNVFMFGMNDEVVHTGYYPMCHYLFALGCAKRELQSH